MDSKTGIVAGLSAAAIAAVSSLIYYATKNDHSSKKKEHKSALRQSTGDKSNKKRKSTRVSIKDSTNSKRTSTTSATTTTSTSTKKVPAKLVPESDDDEHDVEDTNVTKPTWQNLHILLEASVERLYIQFQNLQERLIEYEAKQAQVPQGVGIIQALKPQDLALVEFLREQPVQKGLMLKTRLLMTMFMLLYHGSYAVETKTNDIGQLRRDFELAYAYLALDIQHLRLLPQQSQYVLIIISLFLVQRIQSGHRLNELFQAGYDGIIEGSITPLLIPQLSIAGSLLGKFEQVKNLSKIIAQEAPEMAEFRCRDYHQLAQMSIHNLDLRNLWEISQSIPFNLQELPTVPANSSLSSSLSLAASLHPFANAPVSSNLRWNEATMKLLKIKDADKDEPMRESAIRCSLLRTGSIARMRSFTPANIALSGPINDTHMFLSGYEFVRSRQEDGSVGPRTRISETLELKYNPSKGLGGLNKNIWSGVLTMTSEEQPSPEELVKAEEDLLEKVRALDEKDAAARAAAAEEKKASDESSSSSSESAASATDSEEKKAVAAVDSETSTSEKKDIEASPSEASAESQEQKEVTEESSSDKSEDINTSTISRLVDITNDHLKRSQPKVVQRIVKEVIFEFTPFSNILEQPMILWQLYMSEVNRFYELCTMEQEVDAIFAAAAPMTVSSSFTSSTAEERVTKEIASKIVDDCLDQAVQKFVQNQVKDDIEKEIQAVTDFVENNDSIVKEIQAAVDAVEQSVVDSLQSNSSTA